jgi:AcrR family transcriptional regulator
MASLPTPRGDKRARTRQALIAATLEIVAEDGFAGASLEAIARRAGLTRGSIYSNFADRDELMIAAVASQGMSLERDFSRTMPLEAQLRRFAADLFDQFPAAAGGGGLVVEYQVYAMSQPHLRAKLAAIYGGMFETIAAQLEAQYAGELAIDAHTLALAVQALAMGLVWQFMLTQAEIGRGEVIGAFEALARGALRGPP